MTEKKDCDIIFELGCFVCEKDKIIKQLREESSELKRLLRLAVDGFEHIGKHFTMCSHDDCDKCPYYIGERLICPDKWKHAEEASELLGDDKQ